MSFVHLIACQPKRGQTLSARLQKHYGLVKDYALNSELPPEDQKMDDDPSQTPEKLRDDQDSAVLDDQDTNAADDKPSHPVAWVVAIALSLLIAYFVPLLNRPGVISPFGSSYLPTLPLILLTAIAMIWNLW